MLDEDLLDATYAIVTEEAALAALLIRLADRFHCTSAAVMYGDQHRPAAEIALAHGVFAEALGPYAKTYAAIDPAPAAIGKLPLGTAAATDRLFSEAERASSRFLIEFYNPLGLYEAMGAPIARSPGQFGVLAVHRGRDRPAFADDEIEEFGEIAAHVARAVALRGRFFSLARSRSRQASMLDKVAASLVVVDPSGQLMEANAAARAALARGDGLALSRSGRFRLNDRNADAALAAALSRPLVEPDFITVPRSNGDRDYTLKVSRLESAPGDAWRLIHIAEEYCPAEGVDLALVRALKLSQASARLIGALLRGETLRSYAESAGISENTVKFHLRSAFRATGVQRQIDLIQLCLSTLNGLGF